MVNGCAHLNVSELNSGNNECIPNQTDDVSQNPSNEKGGHSISQISRTFVLIRRMVPRYLALSDQAFDQFILQQTVRKKDLIAYETFVKSKLNQ